MSHTHEHTGNHGHSHDHAHKDEGHEDHHNHEHTHTHSHAHDHGNAHDHDHKQDQAPNKDELNFDEKLTILLGHWVDHNRSHQQTYDSWAEKAEGENQPATAAILKEISEDSKQITTKLEKALKAIKN